MSDVSELKARLRSRYSRVATEALRDVRDETADAAPVGQTGDTRARVAVGRVSSDGWVTSGTIEAPTPQAKFTDTGAKAHPIDPKNVKYLRFPGRGKRGVVFALHVDHPGTPAQHWFGKPMPARWERALAGRLESSAA